MIRNWLTNPWLTCRVQVVLGIIFVAAAWPKIVDPPSFAHMLFNYRLVPSSFVNIFAIAMPWIELLAGLCLILGVWTRGARWIITAMLIVFIIAISINLARGNAIDCGCFDPSASGRSHEERIRDMWIVIARDLGMLLMCAQLWFGVRRPASPLSTAAA